MMSGPEFPFALEMELTASGRECVFFFFFQDFIYLFMRHTERGRDTGRGRSWLHAGSPTWHLILGPWDHDLSRRQMLNRQSLPGALSQYFSKWPTHDVIKSSMSWAAWLAQWLSPCLWPRAQSWRPGIKSHVGLPAWGLLLPLPVSLPLFVCGSRE